MNCPNRNCNKEIQSDWKRCPFCETPINLDSGVTPPGGIIDSVVKAENIHVGDKHIHEAADPSARQQATFTGMLCPICHRVVSGTDWFECPECKRKYIHVTHQDSNSYACSECSAEKKGNAGSHSSGIGVGAVIADRYELKSVVGEGGMGTVYAAIDQKLGRRVAIKCLSGGSSEEQQGIDRFLQEAKSIASLSHLNIVMVYDVSNDGDHPYICMELLDGKTLDQLIKQDGKFTLERTLPIVKGVGQALSFAHKRQVIHRDIKPSNVILTNDNVVKILDFGLARVGQSSDLSKTGYGIGTEAYASPEQRRDAKRVDYRADIYSFGATVYELLTNESPMVPREDRLPSNVAAVVLKAMEPIIEKRYFTIDDFVRDYERVATAPVNAKSDSYPKSASLVDGQCPECNHVSLKDARYCESCGAGLFTKCSKCDNELRIDKVFCPYCGAHVERYKKYRDHLHKGKEHLEAHKYSRAIKEFELAHAIDPDSEELKKLHTEATEKQNQVADLTKHAEAAFDQADYEKAERLSRLALAFAPESDELEQLLSRIPAIRVWQKRSLYAMREQSQSKPNQCSNCDTSILWRNRALRDELNLCAKCANIYDRKPPV